MSHPGHDHGKGNNKRVLFFAFIFTTIFAILEIFYGITTSALSLISEGTHMLSDGVSLFIAALAVILAGKAATGKKTFGFRRAEAIAAFLNGIGLILIPLYFMFEAVRRMVTGGKEILSKEMFVVAVIGLIVNIIVAYVLSRGDKDNINLRAALLHIVADLLSSVSTIIVSLLVMYYDLIIVDSIASFLISIIILIGGIKITKESIHILMEGTPEHLDITNLKQEISNIDGVKEVSELNIWSLASNDNYAMIKIHTSKLIQSEFIKLEIRKKLDDLHIHNSTIEIN